MSMTGPRSGSSPNGRTTENAPAGMSKPDGGATSRNVSGLRGTS